jgi:predicted transcriptional regulator
MVPMYASMLRTDRKRCGLRVCRAAWLLGVSVREYRELEAGTTFPTSDTYDRMCELFGWSQRFVGSSSRQRQETTAGGDSRG